MARLEIGAVRCCANSAHTRIGELLALGLSWLGNALIYPLFSLATLLIWGSSAIFAVALGAINIVVLHLCYPAMKRFFSRPRPFRADPKLHPLLPVLDEYSFPSGHVMTLTGVLVPVAQFHPASSGYLVALWAAMGWARMASAHHYPSDILAGTALALLVAIGMSEIGVLAVAAF